ncbi:hypothetical protein VTN96DRAFT_2185 [Rasamsonia emersonii]
MAPPKKTMPPPPRPATTATTITTALAGNDLKKNKRLQLPQSQQQQQGKPKKIVKRVHFADDNGPGTRSQSGLRTQSGPQTQNQTRSQPQSQPPTRINRTNDRRRTLRSASAPVRSSASAQKAQSAAPSAPKKETRNVMAISSILNESEGHDHDDNRSSVNHSTRVSEPARPEPRPGPSLLPGPTSTASTNSQPLTTKANNNENNKNKKPTRIASPDTMDITMKQFEEDQLPDGQSIPFDNPIEFFQQRKQLQYEQAILDILGDLQLPFEFS